MTACRPSIWSPVKPIPASTGAAGKPSGSESGPGSWCSIARELHLVWRTLSKYGVNPIVFLVIDMATSWPYGLATARIVVNVVKRQWREVRKWSWVAAITFIAPDIYVLASARHAPRDVYFILILVITALVLFAVLSVVLQIQNWGKLALGEPE